MTAPVKPADIVTGDPAESQARLVNLLGQHATVLDSLTAQNRSQAERLETVDKMIPELRQSMAELRANIAAASIPTGGPESELRQYVKPDGKIRLIGGASDGELWQPGLLDDGATHGEWHRRMKELVGMRSVARIARAAGDSPKLDKAIARHRAMAPLAIRAAFGDSANDDWQPTENFSADLERAFIAVSEGTIAAQFPEVAMSSGVLTVPYAGVGGKPYLRGNVVADPAQFTKSLPDIDNRTHTAKTFAMRIQLDADSAEDAVVDAYQGLMESMAYDLADGVEDAMVNGDTTASHGDTGIANWSPELRWGDPATETFGSTADHRRAWIGLRHWALDIGATATTDLGSTQTFDGFMGLRGKLAARSGGAIGIVSERVMYSKILTMTQVQESQSVVGTANPDGRVLTLGGIALFVSPFMSNELTAAGIYDGVTKTKSGIVLASKLGWKRYVRRGQRIEIASDITRGTRDMVGTIRMVFKSSHPSTARIAAYGYNLL
jgi:hypothetical protein